MYEKSNYKGKNGQKNSYLINKGKKRRNKSNRFILISSIVFMLGILITFILHYEDKIEGSYKGSNISQGKDSMEEDLREAPKIDSASILTIEEIKLVKDAIESDIEGYFRLINKDNRLSEGYEPENLVIPNVGIIKDRSDEQNFIRADMAHDVETFLGAAKEAGYDIFLSSGYRSFNLQWVFYNNDLQENGGIESGYVAAPGASEHQLGLAMDLTSYSVNFELTGDFENTPEGQWAIENAHKYGFILRYTEGKENITGYFYEPWHYRYIGNRDIAKLCYQRDITLEELMELIK